MTRDFVFLRPLGLRLEKTNAQDLFRETLKAVQPIRLKEPLAETLGAFEQGGEILEYSLTDVVKMAGHACPTVTGSFLACQLALEKLYGSEVPVRGEIEVTAFGEPDDGVYGVMAQVFSFITGAAGPTGFKGLGHRFKRKDLLKFSDQKPDPEAMCFQFKRLDTGESVLAKFSSQRIPFSAEKALQMGKLFQPVLWEAATAAQRRQFQDLWMEKIQGMLAKDEIENWLIIEPGGN